MEEIKMKEHFKEGDDVAHKNNLIQMMTVKEIIYKNIDVPVKAKEDGSGFEKKSVSKLDGILCYWWDDKREYHEVKFHSREIVPWRIALQGTIAVHNYLNQL